jgi:hypothetical protein
MDPKQWIYVACVFCVSLVSGGISAFGPLIISGFGLDPFQSILYNMIPGGIHIVTNIIAAYLVTITKRKMPVLLGVTCFPLAAAAALYALPRGDEYKSQLLAVYFLLQIFQPVTPVLFSWTFANQKDCYDWYAIRRSMCRKHRRTSAIPFERSAKIPDWTHRKLGGPRYPIRLDHRPDSLLVTIEPTKRKEEKGNGQEWTQCRLLARIVVQMGVNEGSTEAQ